MEIDPEELSKAVNLAARYKRLAQQTVAENNQLRERAQKAELAFEALKLLPQSMREQAYDVGEDDVEGYLVALDLLEQAMGFV